MERGIKMSDALEKRLEIMEKGKFLKYEDMDPELRRKYIKLAKNMDANPVGAPNSKEFMELLAIWFPGEYLDLALCLDFRPTPLADIAEKAGMPAEKATEHLEKMAARGTIASRVSKGVRKYRLWPLYAGVFEYTAMSHEYDPETRERMFELWKMYYRKNMVHELGASETSWHRVIPVMDAHMTPDSAVPFEDAVELMKNHSYRIALGKCACREMEQNCDKPLETCLAFDQAADFVIEYGLGREITLDEAIDVLKMCDDAGLVHFNSNNKENMLFLCNCCTDCCNVFRTYTEYNYPHGIEKSTVYAKVDPDKCIGCGTCENDRCPVFAIKVVEGTAVVDEARCIGCGLCDSKCPSEAISLIKRDVIPQYPETLGELSKVIWKSKKANRADEDYVQ